MLGKELQDYNRLLFMKSKIATLIMDMKTNAFIDCNEAAVKIYNLKNKDELIGKSLLDFTAPDLINNKYLDWYIKRAVNYGGYEFEWRFVRQDKQIWDGLVKLEILEFNDEKYLQISMTDITEQKRIQRIFLLTNAELRASNDQLIATKEELHRQFKELESVQKRLQIREEMFRNLVENINCIICEFDHNRRLTYISPVVKDILGYEPEELQGIDYVELIHPEDKDYILTRFESSNNKEIEMLSDNYRALTKSGDYKWVKSKGKVIRDKDKFIMARGVVFDVHEYKVKEEKIRFISTHDNLTGVYNRSYFEEQLLEYDKLENAHPISIFIADINGLKDVNDNFGQEEGNRLLISAVNVIKKVVGSEGIVARMGGDEFAVLLPNKDEKDVQHLINIIKYECQALEKEGLFLSMSIGTATKYTPDENIYDILFLSEERMFNKKLLESKSYRSHLIASLMNVMSEKTFETKEHCQRLASLSKEVAKKMNLNDERIEKLKILSLMHDIGKIAIPEHILSKPGPLYDEEWFEMKKHPEIGYRIAKKTPEFSYIAEEILSHHERWDGKGYPQGLRATEIPLEARILAVVDAFDAMTSDRVYRKAMSIDEALKELIDNAGTQFDPFVVDAFISVIKEKL